MRELPVLLSSNDGVGGYGDGAGSGDGVGHDYGLGHGKGGLAGDGAGCSGVYITAFLAELLNA